MKTLFYGGKILTLSEPLYCEALVEEDGKILKTGSEKELRSEFTDLTEENLRGNILLPGFIDAHSHFIGAAMAFLQVSLEGAGTYEEIKKRIGNFIKENNIPGGKFINARDYDNNLMPGYENPPLDIIDSFAPENPLIIHHKSGHMGLMNSRAMEYFGITEDTPIPEGGKAGRTDGKLNGYFEENAFIPYIKSSPAPDTEKLLEAIKKAQKKYASYGIVSAHEGMVAKEMIPLYQALSMMNILSLPVKLYLDADSYEYGIKELEKTPSANIKPAGIKIFLDGSPQGRTAWLKKPYEGEAQYCGYGIHSDEEVIKYFNLAAENGIQLIAHANGDAAIEQFLRCLETAEKTHPELKNLRPVIIHGQIMDKDQVEKAAALGAMASFFVAHTYHWGDVHIRNLGFERASHISPAGTALKKGLKFTFHQDTPVIEPDMLETLWCAVTRTTKDGVKLSAEEALTPLEALKAVTLNSAYQYGEENITGSIEENKNADFVLLNKDPLEVLPDEIKNIKVLKTYKSGKCIYEA